MFYVDDIPQAPLVIEPPEGLELGDWDTASALLIDPTGFGVALDAALDLEDNAVAVLFPDDESPFDNAGIYRVRVILGMSSASPTIKLPDVRIVAQDPEVTDWHTLDSIRDEWADAEHIPDALLYRMLEVSKGEVLSYGPTLADDDVIPSRFKDAQGMQARNRWNARRVSPDGGMGSEEFVIRPFPLDWHVKATIRPKRVVGGMF